MACPVDLSCGECLQKNCTFLKGAVYQLCARSSALLTGSFGVVLEGPLDQHGLILACGGVEVPAPTTTPMMMTTITTPRIEDVSVGAGGVFLTLLAAIAWAIVFGLGVRLLTCSLNRRRPVWWVIARRRWDLMKVLYVTPALDWLWERTYVRCFPLQDPTSHQNPPPPPPPPPRNRNARPEGSPRHIVLEIHAHPENPPLPPIPPQQHTPPRQPTPPAYIPLHPTNPFSNPPSPQQHHPQEQDVAPSAPPQEPETASSSTSPAPESPIPNNLIVIPSQPQPEIPCSSNSILNTNCVVFKNAKSPAPPAPVTPTTKLEEVSLSSSEDDDDEDDKDDDEDDKDDDEDDEESFEDAVEDRNPPKRHRQPPNRYSP